MKPTFTVKAFFSRFPNDDACLDAILAKRMGGERMVCARCGRNAKFYRIDGRRAYACQFCGDHFYPCVGTPFEDSRTSLQSWFYAMYLFTTTRHGVPAKELERQLGVTYKTAWRMARILRELMKDQEPGSLDGHVEIDEAYFGGKKKDGTRGRGASGKTILMGMTERDGNIKMVRVPNVRTATLRPIIHASVAKGATISTDELNSYKLLSREGWNHGVVRHGQGEYAKGIHHVNTT
ncbi:MAG: IS1595 family transposase, partial [Alphaproteobacteria bacterium]|nr:IS1595 family transposase [Alphaproteobacteria bacterium]